MTPWTFLWGGAVWTVGVWFWGPETNSSWNGKL